MKFTSAAVLVAGLLVAGCATPADVSTPNTIAQAAAGNGTSGKARATDLDAVRSKVKFEEHPHLGGRTATGPKIRFKDPGRNKFSDGYAIYNLTAADVGRAGPDIVQFSDARIYVEQSTYGDWPSYNAAYSEGERFPFEKVDSDVSCNGGLCLKKEIVGIDLSIDQLRDLAQRPVFEFQVTGRNNDMIVQIPQSYIQGFLAAIDEAEAG